MTLICVLRNWSLKHIANTFSADFDAEYPGNCAAGTIDRCVPVLHMRQPTAAASRNVTLTHKIIPDGPSFAIREGRNACVTATRLV